MSYVPPHKRHPNAASSQPLPAPPPGCTKVPRLQKRSKKKNNNDNNPKTFTSIVFAKDSVMKWFVVGLVDDSTNLSTFTTFEPVLTDSLERNFFGLVPKENCKEGRNVSTNPWEFVAEKVKEDLAVSLQKVRDVIKGAEVGDIKPFVLVRFGKVLLDGSLLSGLECTKENLEKVRRSFYTNVATSHMQRITDDVVPRIGLELLAEREMYLLVLSDDTQPGLTVSCKCDVNKVTNSLHFRKFVVNPVRHFVADFSCLEKNLDLRLMIMSKRNAFSVTEEELENIKNLISYAKFDEGIKGGLKWPLGQRSSDRHSVVAVWHTTSTTFRNSLMKLKVRVADRYNFRSSEGEIAREVTLKMTNIVSKLGEETLDMETAFEMLKDNLELIWKAVPSST